MTIKTLLQLLVYAVVVICMIFGFGVLSKGQWILGAILLVAGVIAGGGHFFLAKVRPYLMAKSVFQETIEELGFEASPKDQETDRFLKWLIREHGNTDLSVQLESIYAKETGFGQCFAGRLIETGEGFHLLFFVIGFLENPQFDAMDSQYISKSELRQSLLNHQVDLPKQVLSAIDNYPYDIKQKGITFSSRLEPREVLDQQFSRRLKALLIETNQIAIN